MGHRRLLIAAALLPILALAVDRLNIKTGLWEIVTTIERSGMPAVPPEVLASMTPEQRAQMASMLDSGGAPRAHTNKECVSEKDLAQPFKASDAEQCSYKVTKATATSQEADVVCSGDAAGTGKFRISAPTPQSMTGTFDLETGEGDEGMTVHAQMKGRWLSESCKGATD